MRIAILGAGAIGCFVGGHWANAADVTLIGRQRVFNAFRGDGLVLTGGHEKRVPVGALKQVTDPSSLSGSDLIVLATKSTGLEGAADTIAEFADEATPVLSLMNGVSPARELSERLGSRHPVIAGMVPFNVVMEGNRLHRSSAGELTAAECDITRRLSELVGSTGVPVSLSDDIEAVQHGKLLLNLINPVNALSGLPLRDMLSQRGYRRIYAAAVTEALAVYDAAGVEWRKVGPFSPAIASRLLAMPDFIFNTTILKIQGIEPGTMTSMAQDIIAGRTTEIDVINGEIVRLSRRANVPAPVNEGLVRLIESRQAGEGPPRYSAEELQAALAITR